MRSARTIKPVDMLAVIAVAIVIVVAILGHNDSPAVDEFARFRAAQRALPERSAEVSVALVGDVMLSRDVARKITEHGNPDYPFLKAGEYLKTADIVFGNLESPIVPGRDIATHEMVFRADPGAEAALKRAGFSVLSLANNHVLDFGEQGLRQTMQRLDEAGIAGAGAGLSEHDAYAPAYVERAGMTFAFLAFCENALMPRGADERTRERTSARIASLDHKKMAAAVGVAKKRADVVIVSMHAGVEYRDDPAATQTEFARAAVDAGADLVVGHHPHVVQRIERYKGKYILCSLGNFIFDQMWSRETREGLIAKAVFNNNGVERIELAPVFIEDFAQPKMVEAEQAGAILRRCEFEMGERRGFIWNADSKRFTTVGRKVVYGAQKRETGGHKSVKSLEADLNNDGRLERYDLDDGLVSVYEDRERIWRTPATWWVDDFALADANGDGVIDINMSVWKAGSFGTTKPFWIRENDWSIKNHFFVFGFRDGRIKPVWQSSALDAPNREFLFDDVDGDGRQELVVVEGEYSDEDRSSGRYVAVWRWDEWGFFNEWRSEAGRYRNLSVEKEGESKRIAVDAQARD
ncbi:MAG: CapA family protein [Actinomycetota bacterium]|nr:CapA family protein [Actinomycetota bacterium]